ncbi:hypothetical protein O181_036379 [Austropuccinia psidii MF-1]|uniref:Reverse transcriptase RNase H-like domain-containing protein n=1 Tax=Austropuccinia psidii MF-1 TaxID=1389203 RepID=A0A9Q3D4K0_9BASI|nr:hypothetical protein [Austropuccinia psidii MF-1]
MSVENDKHSADKDQDEWCLRQSKILKANDPQINIQLRNHNLLTQMAGELEHEVKCKFNQSCTPDDIANTLQDCNFFQNKLLALGHKVSGLSLAIDQNELPAAMQKLERTDAYEIIKNELTNAPVLILPDVELPFKLYIDVAFSKVLGAALHQRQIVDGGPREGVICYISRQLKDSEGRYEDTQTDCLCLVWALEKLHYYLEGAVFKVYTDCTALQSLLNMKTTKRQMLRWQISIQDYRVNMTIIYKEGKSHTNADGHKTMSKETEPMTLK